MKAFEEYYYKDVHGRTGYGSHIRYFMENSIRSANKTQEHKLYPNGIRGISKREIMNRLAIAKSNVIELERIYAEF